MGEWGLRRARPGSSRAVKGRPVGPSEDRSASAGPERPLSARASAAITMVEGQPPRLAMVANDVGPRQESGKALLWAGGSGYSTAPAPQRASVRTAGLVAEEV